MELRILLTLVIELIGLLGRRVKPVVVPREWIESTDGVPPGAQRSRRILAKTTDIGTRQRDTNDILHHHTGYGGGHGVICGTVITEPLGSEFTKSTEGASGDDHRPHALFIEPFVRGLDLHCAEQRVCVQLGDSLPGIDGSIMHSIEGDRFRLQVAASWSVWELVLELGFRDLLTVARPIAEVGRLVHVLPQAIEWHLLMEGIELIVPPLDGRGGEEIRVHGVSWPDLTGEVGAIREGLDEDVLLLARVVSGVVTAFSLGDSGIEDGNVVKALVVELVDEVSEVCVVQWVDGEVPVVVHVVNVTPSGVEWQILLFIA